MRGRRAYGVVGGIVAVVVLALGTAPPALAQPKPRVAVTAFDNKVKTPWWDPSWKLGEGMAEMLTTELVKTGRVIVVERQALGDLAQEQALGQSGLIRRETAAPTGQVLGAQIVVRGAITEFEAQASGGGLGVRGRQFGVEAQAENAHVALDLRLIDTATGQVIASTNVSKVVPSAGAGAGVRVGSVAFGGDVFYRTPIGQATRAAIQDAVQFVLARIPLGAAASFAVVKVEGTTAYINAGAGANVKVGDVYTVFSRGEELTDPDTGLKLGAAERRVGLIEVTEVHEQFSIGTIRDASGAVRRGDRVKGR